METPFEPVADQDIVESMRVPAIFSNKFFITVGPVVRISFAELSPNQGDGINFRTAVALSHQDAISLANVLKNILKPIEEQLDSFVASGVGGDKNERE